MPAEILDGALCVVDGKVLDHLDARDQIVLWVRKRIQNRAHAAEIASSLSSVVNGIVGEVDSPCADASGTQRFDEIAHGTSHVKRRLRTDLAHDVVCCVREKARPVGDIVVRDAAEVLREIRLTVVGRRYGSARPTLRGWFSHGWSPSPE